MIIRNKNLKKGACKIVIIVNRYSRHIILQHNHLSENLNNN